MELRERSNKIDSEIANELAYIEFSVTEKVTIVEGIVGSIETMKEASERLQVSYDTIKSWVRRYRKGTFKGEVGNPKAMGSAQIKKLKEFQVGKDVRPTQEETIDKIGELFVETKTSRSQISEASVKKPCKRTVRRIILSVNGKMVTGRFTTEAREKAKEDIFNAAAFAAAQHLMVAKCHFAMLMNSDGCQMKVGRDVSGGILLFYIPEPGKNQT